MDSNIKITENIENAFKLMNNETKSVVSVCETEHSPLWSNTLPSDLSMTDFIRPELKNVRSQDLPKYYRLNGAVYIADIEYLIENNGFFGDRTKAFIMPQERSVDIDNYIDFELCKILLNENDKNNTKIGY